MLETLWFDMHENINMAIPYSLLVCKNRICKTTTTTNKQTKKKKKIRTIHYTSICISNSI